MTLLLWVLYALWLLAGAVDYFCHRRTDIAHTSGSTESWLHVAQFLCIGALLILAVAFTVTALTWAGMLMIALAHSVLAFIDVAYTNERRHISALEQHVHGYLDVIPLFAVCLIGVIHWQQIRAGATQPLLQLNEAYSASAGMVVLGSFALLAGVPVIEELIRTLRARSESGRGGGALTTSALRPSDRTR